ncbi:MAG TPA: adenylate/guanylate cyclase domain-containing protein [Solirubrobacterales bacterium]|nr:adenylate/guanylate cyclase domain-containing protein [Solirubrobacterales bacterium]
MSPRKGSGRKGSRRRATGRRGSGGRTRAEDQADRLVAAGEQIAAKGRQFNRDPRLLAIVHGLRKVLPGDERVADPKALGAGQPSAVERVVSELTSEHPGVLGEAGIGALQVWRSISEAHGRGRGRTKLAIAFTDLVGFSDWALGAGDEAAIELLRDVGDAIEPPVKDNGGQVVKRLGDGMMAVFKSAEGGLAALTEGRERLAEVHVDGYQPRIRAGMHVGHPRKVGKDYFGVDINIAARIAEEARPGELLLSDAALEALGEKPRSRGRTLLDAKGVPEDFRVHAVAG